MWAGGGGGGGGGVFAFSSLGALCLFRSLNRFSAAELGSLADLAKRPAWMACQGRGGGGHTMHTPCQIQKSKHRTSGEVESGHVWEQHGGGLPCEKDAGKVLRSVSKVSQKCLRSVSEVSQKCLRSVSECSSLGSPSNAQKDLISLSLVFALLVSELV